MTVWYPEARVVVFATFEGAGDRVTAFPALPLRVDVQRNSYDQADSWSVEFDHKDFPIAPQSLRACGVEIYLYDKGGVDVDLASLAGTPASPRLEPAVSGLVDEADVEYESDRRVVLSGQDYTALFMQKSWKTLDNKGGRGHPSPVPHGRPLDELLRSLIREVDATGRITLEVRSAAGLAMPVVGAAVGRTIKSGFKTDHKASYWTVMAKMARIHGFLLFVEGSRVVLTTPEDVFSRLDAVYRFKWGSNLSRLRMSRKLGKERVPQVEVRSYDDRTRTTITARYPATAQEAATGVGTKRDERQVHLLYGIRDKLVLERAARTLYELLGRGESSVEFATDDPRDLGDLDILALRTGDAVMIEFDALEEVRCLEPPQIYTSLVQRGYPSDVATFLSQNYARISGLKAPMYLREARLSWDNDDGVSVDGTLINFVSLDGVTRG